MNSKEIQKYKEKLKLKEIQRSILTGLLLGDGHLETQNNGKTYRLKVEHSLEQEDYVMWLYNYFKEWAPSGLFYKKRKNGQESVGFTTYSHGTFRFYGQQFYKGKVKVIPKLIHKLLNPIGLAVWVMDDGSRKSSLHKTYIIHTLGYAKPELKRICDVLLEKFGLKTKLHAQKGRYWRLYILSESANRFREVIKPYVKNVPSMKHKLSNTMPKR